MTYCLLIFQILVASIFIIILAEQVLNLTIYSTNYNNLGKEDYSYFEAHYPKEFVSSQGDFDLFPLTGIFKSGTTFSYIRNIKDTSGNEVIIGIGNFKNVYDVDKTQMADFFAAYAGEELNTPRLVIPNLGIDTPIQGKLKNKAFFLISALESLDDKVLLVTDFASFKDRILEKMDPGSRRYALMDLFANLKFVTEDSKLTAALVANAQSLGGISLSPQHLNSVLNTQMQSIRNDLRIVTVFFIIYLLFLVLGVFMFLLNILYGNLREYAIHKMCGANNLDIVKRLNGNVLLLTLIPYSLLILLRNRITASFPLIPASIAFIAFHGVLVGGLVMIFLSKRELNFLRRNV